MKSKIVLHIDTSDSLETLIDLTIEGKVKNYRQKTDNHKSQNLLPLIETVLKKDGFTLKHLTEITVKTGPGSFTGLRVGVTVANTLGFLLKIPVNGQKQVLPEYTASKFD